MPAPGTASRTCTKPIRRCLEIKLGVNRLERQAESGSHWGQSLRSCTTRVQRPICSMAPPLALRPRIEIAMYTGAMSSTCKRAVDRHHAVPRCRAGRVGAPGRPFPHRCPNSRYTHRSSTEHTLSGFHGDRFSSRARLGLVRPWRVFLPAVVRTCTTAGSRQRSSSTFRCRSGRHRWNRFIANPSRLDRIPHSTGRKQRAAGSIEPAARDGSGIGSLRDQRL